MPEGLSPSEVGKEIGHHAEHAEAPDRRHDRVLSIVEAVLLSLVAVLAAYSGYAAAKWGTALWPNVPSARCCPRRKNLPTRFA